MTTRYFRTAWPFLDDVWSRQRLPRIADTIKLRGDHPIAIDSPEGTAGNV
jgi:hypothetical protein